MTSFAKIEGDVVCARMGTSRVFRIPTFYLTGEFDLVGRIYYGVILFSFE